MPNSGVTVSHGYCTPELKEEESHKEKRGKKGERELVQHFQIFQTIVWCIIRKDYLLLGIQAKLHPWHLSKLNILN